MGKNATKAINEQVNAKLTEAQLAALKKREEQFSEELNKLLAKHKFVMTAIPHYNQMQNGGFVTTCTVHVVEAPVDDTKLAGA